MEIQWEKKSDLFRSWICCGAKWNVSLCKNEVCVSAFSVNFTVLYFMRFVLNFTLTTLKPKARYLNSTAISKRWGSKAEWVWEMSCAWLAEWHNYAEFNLWKMVQRKKTFNRKACARLCRPFFATIWASNRFSGPFITAVKARLKRSWYTNIYFINHP